MHPGEVFPLYRFGRTSPVLSRDRGFTVQCGLSRQEKHDMCAKHGSRPPRIRTIQVQPTRNMLLVYGEKVPLGPGQEQPRFRNTDHRPPSAGRL